MSCGRSPSRHPPPVEVAPFFQEVVAAIEDKETSIHIGEDYRTVVDKNTTLVLDTSVAPLHWLKNSENPEHKPTPTLPIPRAERP